MADGALTLEAQCPTGRATQTWEQIAFLDEFDLPLPYPATGAGLRQLHRAAASPTNPYWLHQAPVVPDGPA
jgi:hypothetical protein